MNAKLENKCWWAIYEDAGCHPDDLDHLDWSSVDALEKSLEVEYDIDIRLPRDENPDQTFTAFCQEASSHSIMVDKKYAFKCAMLSSEVKKLWSLCNPPSAPEVDNEIMAYAQRKGALFVV